MAEIKEYSLVKKGKVVNRIVADEAFIDKIRHEWDYITDDVRAQKGRLWDGKDFSEPEAVPVVVKEAVEEKLDKLFAKVNELDAKVSQMQAGKVGT